MEMIRHVTIENMLTARDERAQNQNMLREKHCVPIVSFTLNIPGSIKSNELIKKAFRVGKSRVLLAFEKLQDGSYAPYGEEKKQQFLHNLGG